MLKSLFVPRPSKRKTNEHVGEIASAYAAEIPAPRLYEIQGRVVVKFLSSENPGRVLQTIGRVNRGDISSLYSFVDESSTCGVGSSGQVRIADSRLTGRRYAVKSFIKSLATKEKVNLLRNEAQIYLQTDHPHIVRLIDVWEDNNAVHFVMEYCPDGDLLTWIATRHRRVKGQENYEQNEMQARAIMTQIIRALLYLHTEGITHRDIKPDHFLIDGVWKSPRFGPQEDIPYVKLIDFGLARYFSSSSRPMKASCGTLAYTAPEVLLGNYTNLCDLWSAGVVCYMLLTGVPPFYGSEENMTRSILSRERVKLPSAARDCFTKECLQFMARILNPDRNLRLSAAEAFHHPWLLKQAYLSPASLHVSMLDSTKLFTDFPTAMLQAPRIKFFRKIVLTIMAYGLTSDELAPVRDLYLFLDQAGTGTLALTDVSYFLGQVSPDLSQDTCTEIVNAMDFFGRGRIGFNDFVCCLLGAFLPVEERWILQTFWKFDRRRTGLISVENLREVLGSLYGDRTLEKFIRESDRDADKYIDFGEFAWVVNAKQQPSL